MLTINVPDRQYYDEIIEEFKYIKASTLHFEHSLASIEKWEARYKRAFLTEQPPKTNEEMLFYIQCMLLNDTKENRNIIYYLQKEEFDIIEKYVSDRHCATYIQQNKKENNDGRRKDKTTAELVYYWMIKYGIPFECAKWNYYKLMALIYICQAKEAEENKAQNKGMPKMPSMKSGRRKPRGF